MPDNQNDQILQHLRKGRTVTALSALELFGSLRLSGRIYDLRTQGHNILSEMCELPNGKRVAEYRLAQ